MTNLEALTAQHAAALATLATARQAAQQTELALTRAQAKLAGDQQAAQAAVDARRWNHITAVSTHGPFTLGQRTGDGMWSLSGGCGSERDSARKLLGMGSLEHLKERPTAEQLAALERLEYIAAGCLPAELLDHQEVDTCEPTPDALAAMLARHGLESAAWPLPELGLTLYTPEGWRLNVHAVRHGGRHAQPHRLIATMNRSRHALTPEQYNARFCGS